MPMLGRTRAVGSMERRTTRRAHQSIGSADSDGRSHAAGKITRSGLRRLIRGCRFQRAGSFTRMSVADSSSTSARRLRRIGPMPHQCLGPARLARRAVSVKEPLNPNYISIWLWAFFASQRSAAFFVAQSPGNKRLISLAASAVHPSRSRPILSGRREKPALGRTAPRLITGACYESGRRTRDDRGFSPPYEISYRGVKPARVSAGLGRCGLWREADVPQVSSCDQM